MDEKQNTTGEGEGLGPMAGIIIIVVLLLLGGFYFWKTKAKGTDLVGPSGKTAEEIAAEADPTRAELSVQSSSDELQAIEGDLNSSALDALDAGMQDIDRELAP